LRSRGLAKHFRSTAGFGLASVRWRARHQAGQQADAQKDQVAKRDHQKIQPAVARDFTGLQVSPPSFNEPVRPARNIGSGTKSAYLHS